MFHFFGRRGRRKERGRGKGKGKGKGKEQQSQGWWNPVTNIQEKIMKRTMYTTQNTPIELNRTTGGDIAQTTEREQENE